MPRKGERKAQAVGNNGSSTAKKKSTRGSAAVVAKKARTATARTATAADAEEATLPGDDAVALLKADHREVETMFAQYKAAGSREERARLTQQICRSLSIHARLEDELFYPACRERGVETDLMDEAQVEHDGAAMLIEELLASEPDAPFHDAKVKVLGEYIQMHVREEEMPSGGIFAKARSAGLDMSELGQRIKSRKQELEMRAQTKTLHPPTPRSLGNDTSPHNGEHYMARFNQERDEQGRFVSDDDRRSSGRERDDDRRSSSRDRDDDRRYSRSRDDDDRSSSMRRDRDDDDRSRYSRGRDDDDRSRSGRGRDDDDRGRYSRGRDDDDRGRSSSRGRDDDRDNGRDDGRGQGQGGWFGDSEGHSRAAQRGWDSRRDDDDDDRGGRSSRSRSDDNRSRSGGGDDRGQGGWFGDSEGHSRAAQRGWESRRDDDRQGSRSGR